jgi:mannose-1-phosphate guanylyltransferase
MLPVLNRPFLEHSIAHLKESQVEEIILAVSYLPEVIQSHLVAGGDHGAKLIYVVEDSPLGTAGAVKNAERYLDGTFVVLNGDIFLDIDAADMLAFHRRKGAKATISLTWVDDPSAFGVVETDSDGRVGQFIEKPGRGQATTNWINAGVYILEPEVLKLVPPNSPHMFEKGLFPRLLELGEPVFGYPLSGYWLDMGTPEKYLQLNFDLLQSKVRSALIGSIDEDAVLLGEGCAIHPLARIVGPAILGENCEVNQRALVKGPVVIGPECYIGEGTSVDRAVLWQGVKIGSQASLKDCVLGRKTVVDEGKQLDGCTVISGHT